MLLVASWLSSLRVYDDKTSMCNANSAGQRRQSSTKDSSIFDPIVDGLGAFYVTLLLINYGTSAQPRRQGFSGVTGAFQFAALWS
jgi:hypothetical protein